MLPSKKSAAALSAVAFGAYIYVSLDAEFAMSGISAYFWVLVWYFLLCFQMTYVALLRFMAPSLTHHPVVFPLFRESEGE